MSRGHVEIAHQVRRLGHGVLQLHTTQEDESYLSLGEAGEEREVQTAVGE
jgi:hypothetical protein